MSRIRHFIGFESFSSETLRKMIDHAADLKGNPESESGKLNGKTLAMIFETPSTRTRISFDVAMHQLGGNSIALSPGELQLGRGESIGDTARVLSRYVDAVLLRTSEHESLVQLVDNSSIPIINGLTDRTHPCQLLADILTFEEHKGPIKGRRITWIGDGNNMAATWIQAAYKFDFSLTLACPPEHKPEAEILHWAQSQGAKVFTSSNIREAAKGADCIVTDTWVSMSDDPNSVKVDNLKSFQVDESIMARADKDAIFLHCLPAKRGLEVSAGVLESKHSAVFDAAENRLHTQKAILLWCLAK